jgi:hypothetical protein
MKSDPHGDDIKKKGLWELSTSESRTLLNGIGILIKEA